MINVVGIGPGDYLYINDKVKNIIEESEIIIGAQRQIDIIDKNMDILDKEMYVFKSDLKTLKSYIKLNISKEICILASGDPSLYGIGNFIQREFLDISDINIIPGISVVQLMFSKIGQSMNDLYISSGHGREPDFNFIFLHSKVALLTDKKNSPAVISKAISSKSLNYKMYVGYNLSYEDEEILEGRHSDFEDIHKDKLAVVVLIKE
ncbi:precorrin-6y C5,15-methyltransferase (decarboxylating) subunit CbiE [Peptostreptococcus equinus]|uniref:Precorrin-6y C5,15-methyltransferase (Decarboxylating) subunit CbiE n=1 Tax=Peptostreptococcus equinus TaxID=3003601 RepID=A0ABY7JQC2_9FIRM|nr:precorrin-6y C5,15-methyltransferase (decarboxylating) subunit CbiE [Peptostreptococcus sp. CBA3647]WAW15096.1 precorrin-6y C5,15-methyltransferase (decarboxylating) subunit CbiE [Peptostreptococcus sp. CBA3647]